MIIYDSGAAYISESMDIAIKVGRLDQIIAALLLQAEAATANVGLSEYNLDDGQTKIRAAYRGPDQILTAILGYERLRNYYTQRLGGRKTILVDYKNFGL